MKKSEKNALSINDLQKKVDELEQALRITQMLIQQMGMKMQRVEPEMRSTKVRVDMQYYNFMALLKLTNVLPSDVDALSREIQVEEFDKASLEEDEAENFVPVDEVKEDGVVIFTSSVEGKKDAGVLRSKVKMVDIHFEELKAAFIGKKVGDVFDHMIGDDNHTITILGAREPGPEVQVEINE